MNKYLLVMMLISCLYLVGASVPAAAKLRLPPIISDGMVLQRDRAVTIWGTAGMREAVTVSLAGQSVSTVADQDGKWQVKLAAMKAGGPYELVVKAQDTVTVHNVLVGEVWLCSGQSNMAFGMGGVVNAQQEIAQVNNPDIRMFGIPYTTALVPQESVEGTWRTATPQNAPYFSAVGYFMARELQKALKVPIGIINSSMGGTCIEAWTSRPALAADEVGRNLLAYWDGCIVKYPDAQEHFNAYAQKRVAILNHDYEEWLRWEASAKQAKAEGKPEPPAFQPSAVTDIGDQNTATVLYNAMIAPLTHYAIRGAAWYQGEANAGAPERYRYLLALLIQDWRKVWGQGDFPFLVVQLPGYMPAQTQPVEEGSWAGIREAELTALCLPKTAVLTTIDVGDAVDIHPPDKAPVGARLAKAALHITYRRKCAYSGPLYKSMTVAGDKGIIHFDHVEGGLVAKGGALKSFAIAGADRKFVWAQAEIQGDTVVVWADDVKQPAAVRYGWANNPPCNLFNTADLPASPFRTDNWEK
jgi:sialate O-acetylesterase